MKEYKKLIIIGIFTSVTIILSIVLNGIFKNINTSSNSDIKTETKETLKTTYKTKNKIIVEIKGEVLYPGVYSFYADEVIVMDVINMAGGLTINADTSLVNCAEIVENHSMIVVGSKGKASYVNRLNEETSKININTASLEELMTLEGIGEVKANKIISYRKSKGFFTSINDLVTFELITEALFEKVKDYITV